MKNKSLLLIFLILIGCSLTVSAVSAKNVAYLLKDFTTPNADLISVLNEMGLTYDTISESNIPITDFSQYNMILVGNQNFLNPNGIPYNSYPTLMINRYHYYTNSNPGSWGWSTTRGQQSANPSPVIIKRTPSNSLIEEINKGLPNSFSTYSQANQNLYYLKGGKASGITLPNYVSGHTNADAVIAVAQPGNIFLNGKVAASKSIFYGVTETQYWKNNSRALFKNCIEYLARSSENEPG